MAKSKKEIDKDIMYSKIMPTGLKKAERQAAQEEHEASPAEDAAAPAPSAPAAPPQAPEAPAAPPPLFNRSGVQLREKNQMVVVNVMEYLVADKLDTAFSKFNCCKCDKCRKDVAALALNKLKPKYVVTEEDKLPALISNQTSAEVTTALVQAILAVRAHPRH